MSYECCWCLRQVATCELIAVLNMRVGDPSLCENSEGEPRKPTHMWTALEVDLVVALTALLLGKNYMR